MPLADLYLDHPLREQMRSADAALRRAFDREPVVAGYDKTDYAVRWSDGLSGIGREGSSHGLDEYMETKYLALSGL